MIKTFKVFLSAIALLGLVSCTGGGSSSGISNLNIFQYHLGGEPTKLNPVSGSDLYNSMVKDYLVDRLMVRDPDTLEWMPLLAESYEVGENHQTFTFKLREGAKFHDGEPVTAEDVKFSVEAFFIDEYGAFHRRPYYESIEKIEVKDPRTVVFYTKDRYFKNLEVIGGLSIIPKHIYGDVEKGKDLNNTMIGSGPYKMKRYDRGQMIVLERNPDWIGNGLEAFEDLHNFDEIMFKFPKEDAVALQMLRRGDLDYMPMSAEQFIEKTAGEQWEKRINKVQTENKAPKGTSFIGWNLQRPIFKSKKVRLALYHLLNREEINEKFAFGQNLLATGPWYSVNPAADPSVKPVLYDVEKAKQLLAEDGWKDEDRDGVLEKTIDGQKHKLEFTLMYPNKDSEKYFVLYQNDLKAAGVNLKLQLVEWNSFIGRLDSKDFDAAALAWSGTIFYDPKQIWHSSSAVAGGSNFISYNNPKVDELIDKARMEPDDEKRQTMLRQVYRMIAEDVPYAFMFNVRYTFYGTTPRVLRDKDTRTYEVGIDYWKLDVPGLSAEIP